ncbi:MAG TPA: hypothetical protein VGR27_00585 [Longimicrobiaceae bacterium]|nr:hypothetical protein [Longimicrobiaceae bacterium]
MIRSAWAGLLLLAVAACALVQRPPTARDPSLLTTRPAPIGRDCRVVEVPAELPSAAALVDSAALGAALLELGTTERPVSGHAILSLAYDGFGSNVRRTVIEHDLPQTTADSLQKLVFAHRRALEATEKEWGVRLRLDIGEDVRMRVGRQEYCAARPRDRTLLSPFDAMSAQYQGPGSRDETVWVRVYLDPVGHVHGLRVERGMVSAAVENQLLQYVRTLSFEPALTDGVPVSGSTLVPVFVRRR